MKKYSFILAFTLLSPLMLGACENAKEQLGLEQEAPDEFAVVKRAPLEIPPDYYLRPPTPGAQRPQELPADEMAAQSVFGADQTAPVKQGKVLSEGEAILLRKTGAGNIDPDIRRKVDVETDQIIKEEVPTVDKLLGAAGKKYEAKAPVVDAKAETERLKKNAIEGKPVTEGETPMKEQ